MILSTCNFVNNHNFSDFIIGKIAEEQQERDDAIRRKTKRHTVCVPDRADREYDKEAEWSGRKRSSLRAKTGGGAKHDVDMPEGPDAAPSVAAPDLVTIETTDSYTLTGDTASLHIALKKPNTPTDNNVFRRLTFSSEVEGQGQSQLLVFQLHSHPSYYLATTQLRHLELQSYCEDTLDPSDPDDRFFRCFQNEYGVQILQPHAHKGKYIHHIDNFINIQGLELNLRPPEEYFLHIKTVDPSSLTRPGPITGTTDTATNGTVNTGTSENKSDKSRWKGSFKRRGAKSCGATDNGRRHSDLVTYEPFSAKQGSAVPDISKSSLKRKDSKKSKPKEGKAGMLSWLRQSFKRKKDKSK